MSFHAIKTLGVEVRRFISTVNQRLLLLVEEASGPARSRGFSFFLFFILLFCTAGALVVGTV